VAKKGDWIAGLGSKNAHSGDLSKRLVYAMRVEDVLSMEAYDRQAHANWPHRLPDVGSADLSERLGDCIYDFATGIPVQRPRLRTQLDPPLEEQGERDGGAKVSG
jgi:hypothetical protein